MLKWPDGETVDTAIRAWARERAGQWPELERLGYFGSYARGDWGVGSDLDLVAIVRSSKEPFERRSLGIDLGTLPVPAEILVYTAQEWRRLRTESRFVRMLEEQTVWVYTRE